MEMVLEVMVWVLDMEVDKMVQSGGRMMAKLSTSAKEFD